jgi:hypothetical protein
LYAIFMSLGIHVPHSLFPMWRVMLIFHSRFPWLDLCSRTSSSMICLNLYVKQVYGILFLLLAKFHQISTWKIWFRTIQKVFSGKKKWPTIARFQNIYINSRSPNFYDKFEKVVKNREGLCLFSTIISNM